MSLSDPLLNQYMKHWRVPRNTVKAVKKYIKDIKSNKVSLKVSKTINNLYSALQHFMDDKCLIVVNNFEGADIHSTIEYPLIFRQFDISIARAEYMNNYDENKSELSTLWVPKDLISKLNGNFSTNYHFDNDHCSVLKYLYALWPAD